MKKSLYKYYQEMFTTKKLPQDDIYLKQIKEEDGTVEYTAINLALKNFKNKDDFPISLRLLFKESAEFNEDVMGNIEYKLRYQILKKGELLFIYRKEKNNHREFFFYISKKSTLSVNAFDLLTNEGCIENVEIILCCDKNWRMVEKYLGEKSNYNFK